ncbi:hypothetical protein U1872_06480 [Sphingomonas sp. RB3P16]|uniref:hypothetical protein n=1 Tax=Parasphingomonas frigoris TaxID=3096163 RepID=UPI002FC9CF35
MTDPAQRPFKLAVLYRLTEIIKAVTPANGFVSDLADFTDGEGVAMERVFRGRAWFGADDPLPMISVLEGTAPGDDTASEPPMINTQGTDYNWTLLVQGFVEDAPLHPTDPAYLLLADVRRKLVAERARKLPNDPTTPDVLGLGTGKNRVTEIHVGPGVVRPADDVSGKAYFWLTITLRIFDYAADPYAYHLSP